MAIPNQSENENISVPDEVAFSETLSDQNHQTLEEELAKVRLEMDQFRSLLQRAHADFSNYRRRIEDEHEDLIKRANASLILQILPVLDDFQRALVDLPEDASMSRWVQGVRLIQRSLQSLLESSGLSKIESIGRGFDPWEHEAVSFEETDMLDDEIVTNVIREGYSLNGKVLRPSQVIISKSPTNGDNLSEVKET
jgi:molecular chaperone GrpE